MATDMPWREWPEWTPEKQARHRWLLSHIETCQTCNLRPEHGDSVFCAALEAHLGDDEFAVCGAVAGAGR